MTAVKKLPRDIVVERLCADLIGPHDPHEHLESRPSDVYATGILWPQNSAPDPDDNDRLGADGDPEEGSPADEAEQVAATSLRRPSTAGLSFAVSSNEADPAVSVLVKLARYELGDESDDGMPKWSRHPVDIAIEQVRLNVGSRSIPLLTYGAPAGVELRVRSLAVGERRLVTITLVNGAIPEPGRDEAEAATLFQTSIEVRPCPDSVLTARPARRAEVDLDDERAALLFRNAVEFATGHTCSATWENGASHHARWVSTTWLPTAIVLPVDAQGHTLFRELSAKSKVFDAAWLAEANPEELRGALLNFSYTYLQWLDLQRVKISTLPPRLIAAAQSNLDACSAVASRMSAGALRIAEDAILAKAFRLANRAMVIQHGWDKSKAARGPLRWRPFQLGFLLLTAESATSGLHPDRQIMDLLWFPTGGGKTEAYLGLIALTAFYRRLSNPSPDAGAGVSAVMRYTLRLLTTQQFERSAALILACEVIRRADDSLGHSPFSIGLWVGGEATPNSRKEAYATLHGQAGASPAQLTRCPACNTALKWSQSASSAPVLVHCVGRDCVLAGQGDALPVWTVDEDIYDRRPTLLIGTIDKFAQIVRRPQVNTLFGLHDGRPPDVIIQDELHLISGPLGTVAGLYEAAFDIMLSASGKRPKVIGSTATIRRASDQVLALFDRTVCQFPPPAIDQDDSGFAVIDTEAPGRRYVGVASAGRSAKYTLQAAAASLLQSGSAAFDTIEAANHYWTLVAYFNSLRELGGSLVLMQDDVNDSLRTLAAQRSERARLPSNIEELTSRRSQDEVRSMLELLSIPSGNAAALDAVLATNMLSVGVDIPRLGLMLVYGQPKGIAEYIQATSRVGRGDVAGLIISVLNSAKARDRSHFETFQTWHSTLYRDVEATSVTPFASRARDRALHAVLVATVRHLVPGMLTNPILDQDAEEAAREWIGQIAARAARVDPAEIAVEEELLDRLSSWAIRRAATYWNDYKPRDSLLQSAERAATEKALGRTPGEAWPTMNNMRSVETGTPFRLAERLRSDSEGRR